MRILLAICAFSAFLSLAICYEILPIVEGYALTDGLFWFEDKLFFVDTTTEKICCYHVFTGGQVFCATIGEGHVYFVVPVEDNHDKFVVGSNNEILLVQWDTNTNVAHPPMVKLMSVDEEIHGNRLNHGGVDPSGRLWFGTVNNPPGTFGLNLGSVYTLDANLKLDRQIWPVSLSNGFAWDVQPHKPPKFYYLDAMTFEVVSYNYHVQLGTVDRKQVIIHLPTHGALGFGGRLAVDNRGWLWVPIFGEGRVIEIDPYTETVHRSIRIPAARAGGCIFGGPNLDILFVSTTGYGHINPHERRPQKDLGGHIFAVRGLNVKGFPAKPYWLNHI